MVRIGTATLAVLLASCSSAPLTQVTVTNAWAQPLDAGSRSIAAYMTILLHCSKIDTLRSVAVKPPLAGSLHESHVAENMLKMTALTSIPIPCSKPFMLKPLAKHVMVTGFGQPVAIGTSIPLTLTFEDAGEVNVPVTVTTMAVLENVDPMNMHGGSKAMSMSGMHMH